MNLDENINNADWTKRTWDLPPIGSDEFNEYLKNTGQTIEDIKHLPVYKNEIKKDSYRNKVKSKGRLLKDFLKNITDSKVVTDKEQNKDAWSESAREAAQESRRRKYGGTIKHLPKQSQIMPSIEIKREEGKGAYYKGSSISKVSERIRPVQVRIAQKFMGSNRFSTKVSPVKYNNQPVEMAKAASAVGAIHPKNDPTGKFFEKAVEGMIPAGVKEVNYGGSKQGVGVEARKDYHGNDVYTVHLYRADKVGKTVSKSKHMKIRTLEAHEGAIKSPKDVVSLLKWEGYIKE